MLRKLALASLASFILLTPALVTAQTANFRVEEATIEDIQGAIMRGELTVEGRRERQASIHPTEGPFIRSVQILQMA